MHDFNFTRCVTLSDRGLVLRLRWLHPRRLSWEEAAPLYEPDCIAIYKSNCVSRTIGKHWGLHFALLFTGWNASVVKRASHFTIPISEFDPLFVCRNGCIVKWGCFWRKNINSLLKKTSPLYDTPVSTRREWVERENWNRKVGCPLYDAAVLTCK